MPQLGGSAAGTSRPCPQGGPSPLHGPGPPVTLQLPAASHLWVTLVTALPRGPSSTVFSNPLPHTRNPSRQPSCLGPSPGARCPPARATVASLLDHGRRPCPPAGLVLLATALPPPPQGNKPHRGPSLLKCPCPPEQKLKSSLQPRGVRDVPQALLRPAVGRQPRAWVHIPAHSTSVCGATYP